MISQIITPIKTCSIGKACSEHLEQSNETYMQHLRFTVGMAIQFIYVSTVLLMHGLLPFLFTRTASRHTEKIYLIMKSRIPKNRLEVIDGYDI